MLRRYSILLICCGALAGAVVVDRVAVIVGKRVIKTSDIERDSRATEFLNRERLDVTADAKKKSAERLIDQMLIRDDMERGHYGTAPSGDVDAMMKKLLQERYAGSQARMNEELARYGLTEEQMRMQVQWQAEVLGFLNQRFRPGVLVTDEEVRTYYDQHTAELRRQFPTLTTYQTAQPKIRESLEGEKLNQNFEQWLANARKRNRIEYREGALQ
jgi:hypothetical protein